MTSVTPPAPSLCASHSGGAGSPGDGPVTDRLIVPFGGLRPTPGLVHPLVEYLLDLTGKPRARVAFIPTALGDSTEALVNMYARFPPSRTERSHLALFNRTVDDVDRYLLDQHTLAGRGR